MRDENEFTCGKEKSEIPMPTKLVVLVYLLEELLALQLISLLEIS